MAVSCDVEQTRAVALVGMSLSYALAGVLKRAGVLDPEATENAFEAALSAVENSFSPDDPSAVLVLQLLDLMGRQLATLEPVSGQLRPIRHRTDRPRGRPASAPTAL